MSAGAVKFRLLNIDDFDAVVQADEFECPSSHADDASSDDFDAIVRIDEKILKVSRRDYYRVKFESFVQSTDHLPVSIVAEMEDGTVVGFVMGVLYMGEYGISREMATLDSIGVDPDHQRQGIGKKLIKEFMNHVRELGVQKVCTLIDSGDSDMTRFFCANQFSPSKIINFERSLW